MYGRPSSSPASITPTMCGCESWATARASRRKRSSWSESDGDLAVHELDRDPALERRVEGAVDRRHPAGADLGVQPVPAAELHAHERAHLRRPYCGRSGGVGDGLHDPTRFGDLLAYTCVIVRFAGRLATARQHAYRRVRMSGETPYGLIERPDQVRQSEPPSPSSLSSADSLRRRLGVASSAAGGRPRPGSSGSAAGGSARSAARRAAGASDRRPVGDGGLRGVLVERGGLVGPALGGARPVGSSPGATGSTCSPASGLPACSIVSSIWRSVVGHAGARRLGGGLEVGLGLLLALGLALAGLGQRALAPRSPARRLGAGVVGDRAADVGGLGRGGGLLGGLVDRRPAPAASGAGTGVAVLATGPGAS